MAVAVIALGIFVKNTLSAEKKDPPRKVNNREILVSVIEVENSSIPVSVPITGRLSARNRIELYAEVSGMLLTSSDKFREGNRFKKGDLLLAMDDTESMSNLIAQKSSFLSTLTAVVADIKFDFPEEYQKYEDYLLSFKVEDPLKELPAVSSDKERLFLTSRNIYSSYYNIQSAETRLSKFSIRAPFDGMITQAQIKPGTLVRAGQKLGEYISTSNYELEVALNAKDGQFVQVGHQLDLSSYEGTTHWTGKVIRINDRIDPTTQTITIFIGLEGEGLKEGLFLSADLVVNEIEDAFEVDRRQLKKDNSIFIIQDGILHSQNVELLRFTKKTAIIRGLENGTLIPTEAVVGGYDGMAVSIQ